MPLQSFQQKEKKETRETREAKEHLREAKELRREMALREDTEMTQREDTHQEILPLSTVTGSIILNVRDQHVTSSMTRR